LLKVTTPARVSTYAFVNPVVAVFLGWAFAGEQLSARVLVAAAIIILAVVLITFSQVTTRSRSAVSLPAREAVEPSLAEGM
jgi:drug/metabolite transporter (DMT)-like permease